MIKHFKQKKMMARVARPMMDVFLRGRSEEEKDKSVRKAVSKTVKMSPLMRYGIWGAIRRGLGDESVEGKLAGTYSPLTDNLEIGGDKLSTCAHELTHSHGKSLANHYVMAHAISNYMESVRELQDLFKEKGEVDDWARISDLGMADQGEVRPLTKWEKFAHKGEYSRGFDKEGRNIGTNAALIEAETGRAGAGLFYIKLIDDGVPRVNAETMIRMGIIPEVDEFGKKYGDRWEEILEEAGV